MTLDADKIELLWNKTQQFRTLFSDVTRGDFNNFVGVLMDKHSVWFEVTRDEELIGLIWITELYTIVDANAHLAFFDRRPAEKKELCKELIKWTFAHYPMHRITVHVPALYHATDRLVNGIGFTREGNKREALLIGGQWNDVAIYGITRQEAETLL